MGIAVAAQAAGPDHVFDPRAWWTRRRDRKILLQEYEALAFYAFRYW
jgi:hypothetical protein